MITRRVPTLIATGIVVLIPLGITIFALRFLYGMLSGFLLPFLTPLVRNWMRVQARTVLRDPVGKRPERYLLPTMILTLLMRLQRRPT